MKWFCEAAELDSADALYNLAEMYAEGFGVPKNPTEAAKLYRQAAKNGHAKAKETLRNMTVNAG